MFAFKSLFFFFSTLACVYPHHILSSSSDLEPRHDPSYHRSCNTNNGKKASSFSPSLYTETFRPQIHYSPTSGFMNDPCGLVKSGDTWHMYFQYNPTGLVAGNQHWGHATSKDLYTWENHLPSLSPAETGQGIFTGSAILDVNNTSGFFNDSTIPENRFVAVYTLNTATDQNQNIAYSTDGYKYTKYSSNPVIDLNTTQFRDPKVIYDDRIQKWVMAVAHPQDYQIGFYTSSDLKKWTEVSRFGPAGLLGYQYECPNFFPIPVKGGNRDGEMTWMLLVSINPGMPLGGSAVQYFYGDWNGTNFTPNDAATRIADFGKDWYAAQVFYNAPERKAITIGWGSNWQYTNQVPTSPFRNIQSTPRELKLVWSELNPMKWGYLLSQQPYNLGSISHQTLAKTKSSANKTVSLNGNGAFEVKANFSISSSALTNATNPTGEFKIYDSDKKNFLKVGFTFGAPISLYVDRRFAGTSFADSNPYFTDRFSQQISPLYRTVNDSTSDQLMEMRLIIDRTVTEVFSQRGIASALVLTYWDNDSRPASVSVGLGEQDTIKLDSLVVKSYNSTWMECP